MKELVKIFQDGVCALASCNSIVEAPIDTNNSAIIKVANVFPFIFCIFLSPVFF
jgi:hypothetical protein